jgi:hypothetical protein
VRLEASTKPLVHQKFEIFWTNIASPMDCSNSKNRPKKGLRLLGVNVNKPISMLLEIEKQLDVVHAMQSHQKTYLIQILVACLLDKNLIYCANSIYVMFFEVSLHNC